MSTPVWTTTAGKLASIDEQVAYSLQLEANTADSTALTYSVIAGSLPSGMELTSTGLLTGIPAEVSKRTRYTFVVRATAGTKITDRTFYLDVSGADTPTFTTASGQLKMEDSTRVGLYWILDGASINVQLAATDADTRAGQVLVYELVSGELPPGVTMSSTGLVSGVVQLTEDIFAKSRGGFDNNEEAYDDVVYDKTLITRSINKNFDFITRVSDGTSWIEQNNSIFVYSADYWKVSNTQITIDMTIVDGSPLTMDLSSSRRPVFKTASDLGTFRHDNKVVIKIDVEGFEYEVLKGLSKKVGIISFEFTSEFFKDSEKCINYLISLGYEKFNFSLGEKKKFDLEWSNSEIIINKLKNYIESDNLLWGDIYAM